MQVSPQPALRRAPPLCCSRGSPVRCSSAGASNSADAAALSASVERLRAGLGKPGGLPFLTDASLLADTLSYEGPLCSVSGREEYLRTHSAWSRKLPERLRDFEVASASLFALSPTRLVLRWRARFGAPLPPLAEERLAAAGAPPPARREDGLLPASLALTSDLELDASGRLVSHTERVSDGFDVAATVARFEWLQARRLSDPPPVWYYRVLKETSIAEAADASGAPLDDAQLQAGFVAMVGRNFGAGLLIGVAIYAALKAAKAALLVASVAPP